MNSPAEAAEAHRPPSLPTSPFTSWCAVYGPYRQADLSFGATPKPEALLLADLTGEVVCKLCAAAQQHSGTTGNRGYPQPVPGKVVLLAVFQSPPADVPLPSIGDGRDDLVVLTPVLVSVRRWRRVPVIATASPL